MRFVVHIGMAKTGTTSIQDFLSSNRAALSRRGILVPESLGQGRHDVLPIFGEDIPPLRKAHTRVGVRTPEQLAVYRADRTAALRTEMESSAPDIVALSNEQLSSRLRTAAKVRTFADWITGFGLPVEIVVYLRRQDTMHVAAYSTAVKRGESYEFAFPDYGPGGPPEDDRYNLLAALRRWEAAFGRENLTVRLFERKHLVGGDVVLDYLDALGIRELGEMTLPEEANVSLTRDALEFLRLMNTELPLRRRPGSELRVRGFLVRILETVPSDAGKIPVAAAQARAFVDQFAAGNAEVARRYFGREDGVLFDDRFRDVDESDLGVPHLTVERAAELAAHLWIAQQKRINRKLANSGAAAEQDTDEADGEDS